MSARSRLGAAFMLAAMLAALAGCAAASGYDPKRYAHQDAAAPDPDTAPLPAQPKTTIPDPKGASLPSPTKPDAGN